MILSVAARPRRGWL